MPDATDDPTDDPTEEIAEELPDAGVPEHGHEPVLVDECLAALLPEPRVHVGPRVLVDCTTGRGGHASLIAARLGASDTLLCLDADQANLEYARERLQTQSVSCGLHFVNENFTQLGRVIKALKLDSPSGILADLGLSTNQILTGKTGLSFHSDDPLDMRIDARTSLSAAQIVNRWGEKEIADLIYQLADERHSRRIARKIIEARSVTPIQTARRLADVVRSAVPRVRRKPGRSGSKWGRAVEPIDPATRTFLALRMKVNRETDNLRDLLNQAPQFLSPGGVLAVISFQSTEDRIVKHTFLELAKNGALEIVTKKPVGPTDAEVQRNPRSRSAKLRVAKKPAPA